MRRYGVSKKPYALVRAKVDNELIKPMFGPSGVSIGQTRPWWVGCTSRTSKPARSRVKPPGPKAEIRRLWVTSDNGLFWSINCDNWLEPKNSFTAALI